MKPNKYPMPLDDIAARFPRIVRACRAAGILSHGEAIGAVYCHQIGQQWAGEAVNHFGGIPALFRVAFSVRGRSFARAYGPKLQGTRQ